MCHSEICDSGIRFSIVKQLMISKHFCFAIINSELYGDKSEMTILSPKSLAALL